MAKYSSGISGPFAGKVGNVVGCSWKGINYMRSLPAKRKGKPTAGELANRKRFADAQAWLKPITAFVRVGYQGYSPTVEGFVAAKSYLLKNAMEGEHPNCNVNPEKMKVSFGNLQNPAEANASFEDATCKLLFSWDTVIDTASGASPRDQVMMLAYAVELQKAVVLTTGSFRKSGQDELQLPENFRNKDIQVYMAFLSADRSRQSDSLYLGSVRCAN